MKTHDKEYFIRETLPALQWGKLIDMFSYGSQPKAALDMLAFIKVNYESQKVTSWINDFSGLLAEAMDPDESTDTPSRPTTTSPSPSTPPVSSIRTKPSGVGTTRTTTTKSGLVPLGLEPKK